MTAGRRLFWGVVALLGVGSALASAALAPRVVEQPLPYNHAVHTAKADCALCHRGAREGVRAGLPSVQVCTRCHAVSPRAAPAGPTNEQWSAWTRGDGLPKWQRLLRLPPHVFFSHRRHATVAGIACDRCHGDMEHRKTPPSQALASLHMRDCIGCHEAEQVTIDCTACHR